MGLPIGSPLGHAFEKLLSQLHCGHIDKLFLANVILEFRVNLFENFSPKPIKGIPKTLNVRQLCPKKIGAMLNNLYQDVHVVFAEYFGADLTQ